MFGHAGAATTLDVCADVFEDLGSMPDRREKVWVSLG
jgi:hypothetical protein